MKRFWTDADFPNLSWHDNSVHAFRIIEGKDGAGDLVLDIDHIVDWIESEKRYEFRVAPAVDALFDGYIDQFHSRNLEFRSHIYDPPFACFVSHDGRRVTSVQLVVTKDW